MPQLGRKFYHTSPQLSSFFIKKIKNILSSPFPKKTHTSGTPSDRMPSLWRIDPRSLVCCFRLSIFVPPLSLWLHCTMLKMKAQELFSNFLKLKVKIVPWAVSFLKMKLAH